MKIIRSIFDDFIVDYRSHYLIVAPDGAAFAFFCFVLIGQRVM